MNFGRQRQHVMLRAADPVRAIFRDALVSHGRLIVGLEMGEPAQLRMLRCAGDGMYH